VEGFSLLENVTLSCLDIDLYNGEESIFCKPLCFHPLLVNEKPYSAGSKSFSLGIAKSEGISTSMWGFRVGVLNRSSWLCLLSSKRAVSKMSWPLVPN